MRKQPQRLIKILFLLNGLSCILASTCPYTDKSTSFKVSDAASSIITPSTDLKNWPSTTKEISIAGTVVFDDVCAAGETFTIFSLLVTPGAETEIVNYALACDTLKIKGSGAWADTSQESSIDMFSSTTLGPISFMVTISLEKKLWKGEIQSASAHDLFSKSSSIVAAYSFDSLTKVRLCSDKDGTVVKSCTVSNLYFFDSYFTADNPAGYATMGTATLYSFYPLLDSPLTTKLTDSYGGFSTAYFGDKSASPTTETSPSWSTSTNKYLQITDKGQYVTFPSPSFESSVLTTDKTISISAWVKVSSIPVTTATIFTLYASDGTELLLKLQIDQATETIKLVAGTETLSGPTITLDKWSLVGFTASVRSDKIGLTGSIFMDAEVTEVYTTTNVAPIDLSAAAIVRVGAAGTSFLGNVFGVRIATPGGGLLLTTVCSASNSLELGLSGKFPLTCPTGYNLYPKENKCYKNCPNGTEALTTTPQTICAKPTSSNGDKLSAGLVLAVVLSSIAALIAGILFMKYSWKDNQCCAGFKKRGKDQEKLYLQGPSSNPMSPTSTEGAKLNEVP